MKWYHFTGIGTFEKILRDDALLSVSQRMRERHADNPRALRRIEVMAGGMERKEPTEFIRWENIFLTPDNSHYGEGQPDVVLGFELDLEPNHGPFLISPKITLAHLVDVGARPAHLTGARELLQREQDGKYAEIPVYESHH